MSDLNINPINIEPVLVAAGTTWKWQRAYSQYPSTDYTLIYNFREVRGVDSFDITATSSATSTGYDIDTWFMTTK